MLKRQFQNDFPEQNDNADIYSSKFAPYKLILYIHGADNLPVADITTSDPYVVASIGDKFLIRTQTVYRNRLNPTWDKKVNTGLLHLRDILTIEIFDENQAVIDKY